MEDKKVCPKCQHDNFHSPFGCLHGSSLDGTLCPCKLDDNDVDIEILKAKIISLETDIIHARRVADEKQEIIDGLKAIEKDFQILLSICDAIDFQEPDSEQVEKVRELLVKYVG